MGEDFAIPPAVRRFVIDCIPSVVHMEALLMLRSREGVHVRAEAIAGALFVELKVARGALEALYGRGLLHAAAPGGPYWYSPHSPELRGRVDDLADAHRTRLVPLSRFIHERNDARSLEDFANAFRFRKG